MLIPFLSLRWGINTIFNSLSVMQKSYAIRTDTLAAIATLPFHLHSVS
jgi:hypothetical protein